ncbi:MAG: flagellar basal body P-ring protein FlgI [Pseudomonadota bacterium]
MAAPGPTLAAELRIKDVVRFDGVRKNHLVGYGLVVGLAGTGDRLQNIPFTERSLASMLERLGVSVQDTELRTRNVAAVMVTALLPPFSRQGDVIDINVSALGDARSLLGGSLLATPLVGADGEIYAVAQGSLIVSGFSAEGDAGSVVKGAPTSAQIPNGAIVERETGFELDRLESVRLTLRNPDFTTALRIEDAINGALGAGSAHTLDLSTVEIRTPERYLGKMARMISDVERLPILTDQVARVVVDERSGTIVIGENVRISRVAVTQGNITIRINETPQVSQPNAFSENGETVVVPRTTVEVDEGEAAQFQIVQGSVSLQQLVDGLNALGVTPRDVISILKSLKAAGALHGELVVE